MKKTSTRIATIGGVVVLAAFAIALAQHDARKRDREPPQIEVAASQPAKPIPLGASNDDWDSGASELTKQLARGNNGRLPLPETETPIVSENPLRMVGTDARDDSRVVQASGEFPADEASPSGLPTLPTSPAWLETGAPSTNLPQPTKQLPNPAPTDPATPVASFPSADSFGSPGPPSSAPTIPALPSFPMNSANKPADPRSSQVSLPANGAADVAKPSIPALAAGMTAIAATALSSVDGTGNPQQAPAQSSDSAGQDFATPPFGQAAQPAANSQVPGSSAFPPTLPTSGGASGPLTSAGGPPSGDAAFTRSSTPYATPGLDNGSVNGSARNSDLSTPMPGNTQSAWPVSSAPTPNGTARAADVAGSLVSNQPGSRYLDGSQNPILLIQKRAPEEIQVGKKATFVITVRNAGNATAHDVRVVDSVPRGVRFVEAAPAASPNGQGILTWSLGEMSAGDERTITLQIIPEVQGELGSVASVHFAAQASVRTVATLPHLELQVETTSEVLIGSRQQLAVTIKNSGTGVARGVRLEADIPGVLKHESGEAQLEAVLGDLRPNELRRITLEVTATQPGQAACAIRATSEDGINAQESVPVQVLAPQLAAAIEGPRLRYLDRQATYQIKVQNIGTAAASNLDFIVHLPAGLKYNSANNRGTYDPAQHTVTWGLFELPVGETAPIEFTVLPVELGPQAITFAATGDLGIRAEAKGQVVVEGLAELAFTIGQDNGTIELGTSTTYSVQVTNVGNKPDKDVRLAVQLPSGAKLLAVDAQVNYQAQGNQIIFEPVAEMGNSDTFTYRFQLQHNQAGTQIVRTQLTSANWPVAVIKEEGTLVYNDQN
jgi:uncharacterized repeat protein (TIGR01451 family)